MEKEIEVFEKLENQIGRLVDLINKLKKENIDLKSENESLKNLTSNVTSSITVAVDENGKGTNKTMTGVNNSQAEIIKKRIESALEELDQLRLLVTNEN
ncbi:MAG: cell division protein ZapB [bacterium]|nr:cell division protein ZapB [bacterium]